MGAIHEQPHYLPTAEEIERACEKIRQDWSPQVEESRRAWSANPPVELPRATEATFGLITDHNRI
jgi:hypothetical protein